MEVAWLEEGREMAECPGCMLVLDQPTVGCPEGHALCRPCYVAELHKTHLELRLRCKNGPEDGEGEGGGEGGAPPQAKRAKLELAASMGADDLRTELGRLGLDAEGERGELVARLEENRRNDAGKEGAQRCSWRGRVCDLAGHLSESCGWEAVKCPNAVAGCTESVLRKDAARHASETCAYRKNRCAHCAIAFEARALAGHEGSCPEAQIECPNAGCGATVARGGMAEHRGLCGREEVECPCPGCEERMARVEVAEHVAASGAEHAPMAWGRAVEMEEKVAEQAEAMKEQGRTIASLEASGAEHARKDALQEGKIAGLKKKVKKQAGQIFGQQGAIAGLRRQAQALTRVFTWSTDRAWSRNDSEKYTFTGGVRGRCFTSKPDAKDFKHFMGFTLEEGPECKMHYKCSILDADDKVFRVVSAEDSDFETAPTETAVVGSLTGASFTLSAADKAGAVRADGSIKLRMVVHLYLPE
ncbi:hypothetical protein T484DRAFT_1775196 [Baffinella frigidus]|nr:hypothetical protein T484DRAFT_1775196 [Cryptophyta sp. CCMP2293]